MQVGKIGINTDKWTRKTTGGRILEVLVIKRVSKPWTGVFYCGF